MEIVGAAASITQLAVYTYSAGRCLRHLYKTSKTSQFSAGSQLEDLNVLLKILDCINSHHTPLDHEVLVPVLISIAETAQTLSNWFLQTSTFYRNWVFFFRKADIQGGYRLLRQKCNFLVFYYSERNNRALNRIESSLNTQYHAASGCLDSMDAPKSNEGRAMEDVVQPEAIEKQDIKKQAIVPDNGTLTSLAGARMNTDLDEAGLARQFFQPHTTSPSHMQSEQPQEKKQNKGQSTRRIVVSNNRHFKTKTDLFNNTYRPNDSLDGSYVSNDIYGEYVRVGNEDPYHASNESDQNEKS